MAISIGCLGAGAPAISAQSVPDPEPHHHPSADQPAAAAGEHQHEPRAAVHDHGGSAGSAARDGSGTAWQPDDTPMYAIHSQAGGWTLMIHGEAFLQHLRESGDRGSHQTGAINWLMGMADRPVGDGHLGLRGMISLEPWTIRGCGYPDLLATGEICRGETIHDRQHPHDLFMELVAEYDRPIGRGLRLQVYGGPVGEPALGPVAFPHRVSAMANPLAPITHHWLDATHIAYGVMTGGVYGNRWKAEASLFNGREPDEKRTGLEAGALDSWSGRFWFLPTRQWALQVSAGRLNQAEPGHAGDARVDLDRMTASATYHRVFQPGSIWASTVGWGRNSERGGDGTQALFAETNVTVDRRDAWFGRFELAEKSAHDLDVDSLDSFTVAKAQAGYTRYLPSWNGLQAGIGASVSTGAVPETLVPIYGKRLNWGVGVFMTLRPAEHQGQ
ncbi:MAG: hypothetical protein ABI868_02825 [Acidobacteriota bacterium]